MTEDISIQLHLTQIIEGLLFVASEPVTVRQLASAVEHSAGQVEAALAELAADCETRGIRLQRHGDKVQLVSAPELAEHIERFLGLTFTGKLSTPALETLAMVAYRQPITRPQIEAIRGVNSDGVLRTLISKGLVEEVGRLDSVGHPALFGTTFEFLRYFGISSLDELPELDLPQLEFPKSDAEEQPVDELLADGE
ncbi:MAG: SMC-Scp complex subunit ScpB [Chloroflexi bacterium]|nr:MAG: SMC-Scp complex subunit ScpB [Chloroflexota bacterium]